MVVLLTRLPAIDWGYVLPTVVFGNLVMVNFYFVAGLAYQGLLVAILARRFKTVISR